MMRLTAVVLVLLAGSAVVAQDLPLPAALMTAKTATVVNAGGINQDAYDRLVKELIAWKHFTLIDDSVPADITIVFTEERRTTSYYNAGTGQIAQATGAIFRFSFKRGETILYSDDTGRGGLKKALERLDKRLRQK